MKPNYKIIEAQALNILRDLVNDAIENGYDPLGGPFVYLASNEVFFCQAMTLRPYNPFQAMQDFDQKHAEFMRSQPPQ